MALKDTWKDKVDGIDDVLASDINSIAHSAIELEKKVKNIEDNYGGGSNIELAQSLSGNEEDKAPSVKAVNDGLEGKVDKVNAKRILYGTGDKGEPVSRHLSQTPRMNAVPQYSSDGRLQTNAPVEGNDASNKQYVDDGLEGKFGLPTKLEPWSILGIGDYNAKTGEYKPHLYPRDPVGCVSAAVATFASVTDESRWNREYKNLKYTLAVPDPIYPIQVANKRYVDTKCQDLQQGVYNALGVLYTFESVRLASPYNEIPNGALSFAYLESIGGVNVYSHATEDRVLVGTTDIVAIHIYDANSERLSTYEPTAPQYIELPAGAVSIVFEYREPTVTVWDTLEIDASIKYQIKVGA